MAAYNIHKHFKGLRVQTARKRGRDPFATGFEDDSDDDNFTSRSARSSGKKTQARSTVHPINPASDPAKPTLNTTTIASLKPAKPASTHIRDSEDEFLDPPTRKNREPSPAPAALASVRQQHAAGRRGSVDRSQRPNKTDIRAAVALAAGPLAYLDETSDDSDEDQPNLPPPSRSDRYPSPAPRTTSDPEGSFPRFVPPTHTVASPFAGTKYLQDSDSDEDAVVSRQGSTDSTASSQTRASSLDQSPKKHLEVQRVDKPKVHGTGISWRAFSAGRAEQRNAELNALQTSLRKRGWSISFASHASTDDGSRVPVVSAPEKLVGAGRGRAKLRRRSPPRRADDVESIIGNIGVGGGDEKDSHEPGDRKIDAIAALPVKEHDSTTNGVGFGINSKRDSGRGQPPDIRIDDFTDGR